MTTFEILPAIDLRAGRVVRLVRGDFDRETRYADDPVLVAQTFVDGGAAWLHVVDLDGARSGGRANLASVEAIVRAVGDRTAVEVAGGLRTMGDARRALAVGAARVVVGTAALADPGFAPALVDEFGADRVVVALDVRDGFAVGHGWQSDAPGVSMVVAIERLVGNGIRWFEITAIARDGTLEGPDLDLLRQAIAAGGGGVIASGGIASVADLHAVRDLGCAAAILGRALYEGSLTLAEALATTRTPA
jgi:phosphoribosylformimino-5-aminoimidazole carboxamide ribotide isomerase